MNPTFPFLPAHREEFVSHRWAGYTDLTFRMLFWMMEAIESRKRNGTPQSWIPKLPKLPEIGINRITSGELYTGENQ